MIRRFTLVLLIASSIAASGLAQSTVSGQVTSREDGEGLPGVNVYIKGSSTGTVTDLDGRYQLDVAPADVLVFSFIGFVTQEIAVGTRSVIDVQLVADVISLSEIVVVGYGVVEKRDLTGSVSSLRGRDLVKIPSLNPEQALQGKVAGVQVTSTTGAPGAPPVIRIRGVGTFNNSSPIFVVDGVILDDISFLNSSDIASMEVLKDASATAIYGSRGANGVIIVTTKTGSRDAAKPVFNYSGEFGMQNLAQKIDLLNGREFAIISNEIRTGSFNNVDAVPNTDWQDLVFRAAPMHNHQISVSGSTEKTQYYMSLGYFGQEGIIPRSSFQRITVKLNNTYHLSKSIRLGNNLTIAPFTQQNAPNVTYSVYRAQPVLEPFYPDGSFGVVLNVGNPLADLEYSNNYRKGIRGVGNLFAEATIAKHFIVRSSFGLDASYNKSESFTPAFTVFNPDGTASQQQNVLSDLFKGTDDNLTWLWENTVNYNREFDRHRISAVAGYTMQRTRSEFMSLSGENIIRDGSDFWYINPAYVYDPANNVNTIQSIANGVDPNQYYAMISYLFRVNYTFNNRYLFTVTYRRDGSSKFSENNRFSDFPSFALGWNVLNEKFMEGITLLSNLKVRASWGMIGNEKISYFDRYARVQSGLLAVFGVNQAAFPAASFGKNGNPDLKWESTAQTNIGLEVGLFDDRLTGEFDLYRRVTEDILVELSTPGHLGNGQGQRVRYNAASVLNRGFEFTLGWRGQAGEDFNYRIGLLGSTIHNEVLSVGGNSGVDSVLIGGFLGDGRPATLSRVGLPIGAFYGYQTDGVFQTPEELNAYPHDSQAGPGDLRFVDVNGDGVINGLDRTFIGSPIPEFIFGFNFEMQYKAFDFSLDLQGQAGNKIFNGKEIVRPDPYNFEQRVWNRWTGPGTSNTEPRPSFGGYNYNVSDHFIQDGSFIRLRNVGLGYTLPENISGRLKVDNLRLYIKGTNLFTLTKFTGYTPEIGSGDVLSGGIDRGIYPVTAIYSVGANITF
jgi:TonB-linked SusC/RagA family outer membrane protein